MRTRDLKLIAIGLYVALLYFSPSATAQTMQIDSATANWIEGFADFVRWKTDGDAKEIKVGIFGDSEVARYLERRAEQRKNQPDITVLEVDLDNPMDEINILFVGHGHKQHWGAILSKCAGKEILTIGEQEGFCESGGSVEFFVQRNLLCFYIHEENLNASGVDVRSQLYAVAKERER